MTFGGQFETEAPFPPPVFLFSSLPKMGSPPKPTYPFRDGSVTKESESAQGVRPPVARALLDELFLGTGSQVFFLLSFLGVGLGGGGQVRVVANGLLKNLPRRECNERDY